MAASQITPNHHHHHHHHLCFTKPSNSNLTSSLIPPLNHLHFNSYCSSRSNNKRLNYGIKCCVNLPLKPSTLTGKSLSTVLQNEPESFYDVVSIELTRLAADRDAASARYQLSVGSLEASLHRRIAKLKETDCHIAVQEVLYMIILQKFSEIRVPLIPSLSKCLYNGRLEILPSKDWELESMHSPEILDIVREYLSIVLGWKPGSSVAVNWSRTTVQRQMLYMVYSASITHGYFLKSASLRFYLEHNLPPTFQNATSMGNWMWSPKSGSHSIKNVVLDQLNTSKLKTLSQVSCRPEKNNVNLKCYVSGLDLQAREECWKLKSEEASLLIMKHCEALFGTQLCSYNKSEDIMTSLSSMKRLCLEAIAFGCFLWDAEQFVAPIYKLNDK